MKRLALMAVVATLAATPVQAQSWKIDTANSWATFTIRHHLVADARGQFGGITGTVEYDGKDVTSAKISATIDARTIDTRHAARDAHLKDPDFFDIEKYPTITFVSTSVTRAADGKFKMTGNLTMRGVTKPVTLDLGSPSVMTEKGIDRIGIQATTRLNRLDYGISWNRALERAAGGFAIGDMVDIVLDIQMTHPTPATN